MTQDCEITWKDQYGDHKVIYTAQNLTTLQDVKAELEREILSNNSSTLEGKALVDALDQKLMGTARCKKHHLNNELHDFLDGTPAVEDIAVIGDSVRGNWAVPTVTMRERYNRGKRQDTCYEPAVRKTQLNIDPYGSVRFLAAMVAKNHEIFIEEVYYSAGQKTGEKSKADLAALNAAAKEEDDKKKNIVAEMIEGHCLVKPSYNIYSAKSQKPPTTLQGFKMG